MEFYRDFIKDKLRDTSCGFIPSDSEAFEVELAWSLDHNTWAQKPGPKPTKSPAGRAQSSSEAYQVATPSSALPADEWTDGQTLDLAEEDSLAPSSAGDSLQAQEGSPAGRSNVDMFAEWRALEYPKPAPGKETLVDEWITKCSELDCIKLPHPCAPGKTLEKENVLTIDLEAACPTRIK